MSDKLPFFAAESGTWKTTSPNPHIDLSGTALTLGTYPVHTFSAAASDATLDFASTNTCTVVAWVDAANWKRYEGAVWTDATPDTLDLSAATLMGAAGTISADAAVSVVASLPSTSNGVTLAAQTVGFTVAGGTTSHTLTVTNTGTAATEEFVLDLIAGVANFYFDATVVSGIEREMQPTPSLDAITNIDTATISTSTTTELATFVADIADTPLTLSAGVIDAHVHALRASGNRALSLLFTVHKRTSGVDGSALTTSDSIPLTDTETNVDPHAAIASPVTFDGVNDRLVIKFFVTSTGGSTNTVGRLRVAGSTTAHVSAPITTSAFDHVYAPLSHTQAETTITFTDVTTGNASTTAHGYSPKATAPAAGIISVLGIANGETVRTDKAAFTTASLTVLDDTTVADMVNTLGGATSTGSGGIARATSPTFVTPALGTPTSGTLTNCTGYPAATTSAAGLLHAVTAPASGSLNVSGIANGETAHTEKTIFVGCLQVSVVAALPGSPVATTVYLVTG